MRRQTEDTMQATIDQTKENDATELERVVLEASAVGQAAAEGPRPCPIES